MRLLTACFLAITLFFPSTLFAKSKEIERINDARTRAESILEKAVLGAQTRDVLIFSKVETALKGATIKIPLPGQDFIFCEEDGGKLAFAIPQIKETIEDTIFLCASSLRYLSDEKFTAQTLIHESAHLVGNVGKDKDPECDATWVEIAAMRYSGEGLSYKNSYMDRCGYR